MIIVGIDPGKKGAVVSINTETKEARYCSMPYRADDLIDLRFIRDAFDLCKADYICIEKVQGIKQWGSTNNFNFGVSYGQLLGMLSDYPYMCVTPKKWQICFYARDKTNTAKAQTLGAFTKINPAFEARKKDEGLIDAFMIAYYAGKSNSVVMPMGFKFIKVY